MKFIKAILALLFKPVTATCPKCGADLKSDGYAGAECEKCDYKR